MKTEIKTWMDVSKDLFEDADDYARMKHDPEDYLDGQRFVGEEEDEDEKETDEESKEEVDESVEENETSLEDELDAALDGISRSLNGICESMLEIDEDLEEEELEEDTGDPITKTMIGHEDNETSMMDRELRKIEKYAGELRDMMAQFPDGDYPHWWQANLVKAGDYISKIKHFLEAEIESMNEREPAVPVDMYHDYGLELDDLAYEPESEVVDVPDELPPEDDHPQF